MKIIRLLLFPLTIIYILITSIRNWMFDLGLIKTTSFRKPIIAVGNLSVGGTGKTPQIEYLIKLLNQHKLAVLSRGYGRSTKGFILADESMNSQDIGDEPLQFFKKFKKINVAVDENRVHGIQQLEKSDVILLDDAFQHRKVTAGFYILLTKYSDLFSSDFVLPSGNLRERRVGVKRANVVVVTKCPQLISNTDKEEVLMLIRRYFKGPVFFSKIKYADFVVNGNDEKILVKELSKYNILLVTGIANPTPLLAFLSEEQCNYNHLQFSDHHQFNDKEISTIKKQFELLESEQKIILTTEKDFTRLSSSRLIPLYYLEIETSFVDKQDEFDSIITTYVDGSL